jgi:hypothetical protein
MLKRLSVYSAGDEEDKYSVRQVVMIIVALDSKRAVAMRRATRGLDTPQGTVGQELAAEKMFDEFLSSIGLSKTDLDGIHAAHSEAASLPTQNMYLLLTAFSIFVPTKKQQRPVF